MNSRSGRFTREQRLSQPADFNKAFKSGRRSRDAQFLVLANRNRLTTARLGMAVSRRFAGSAVKRNMIKRQVREFFRHHQDEFKGWDIVVVSSRGPGNPNKSTVKKSLGYHWQQLSACTSSSIK